MSTKWKRLPITLLITGLVVGLAGCPGPDPDRDDLSISVSDQELMESNSDTITVDEATIDADGFAVVYRDDDGQPDPDPIGASELLESGDHEDFDVELDEDINEDQTLWAVLHYDDGRGEFERADKQAAVTDDDGQRVLDDFEVTVVDDPDVALIIDDQTLDEDEADVITVDTAIIDDDGFVVIYEEDEDNGEPGDDIGYEFIEEGTHNDFEVELDRDADDGETLWGRLHYTDNDDEEFEDEDTHPLVTDADGDVVEDTFVVTVDEDPDPDPDPDEPSVEVSDQTLDDLSTIVRIDQVDATDDGWIAVHRGGCDDPGDVIGSEEIDEGVTDDIDVELEEPAADEGDDEDLCAALYVDDNGIDDFDVDEVDPAEDDDGDRVWETFNVEVEEGTPAIRLTIDTDDTSYTREDVEPSLFEDDFATDDDELEDLDLRTDWRYEFVNLDTDDNPFEFIDGDDEVMLSQDTEGELEDEAGIDWVEDDDSFLFTVSGDFQANVDGYQNAEDTDVTGGVNYIDD